MLKSLKEVVPYSGASRSSRAIVPERIESFSPASLPTTRISVPTRARSGASCERLDLHEADLGRIEAEESRNRAPDRGTRPGRRPPRCSGRPPRPSTGAGVTTCRFVRMRPCSASTTKPVAVDVPGVDVVEGARRADAQDDDGAAPRDRASSARRGLGSARGRRPRPADEPILIEATPSAQSDAAIRIACPDSPPVDPLQRVAIAALSPFGSPRAGAPRSGQDPVEILLHVFAEDVDLEVARRRRPEAPRAS